MEPKISYWPNVKYYQNSHDQPMFIGYNKNGDIIYEEYQYNGYYHRLDGPARIWENNEAYYLYGKHLTKQEYYKILDEQPIEFLEQYMVIYGT